MKKVTRKKALRATPPNTKKDLLAKLQALGEAHNPAVVCAIIGHSRIQDYCFGYYSCSRCKAQVGDALGSVYSEAATVVVVGHDCETCRANAKTLTWKDRLMAKNPFPKTKRPAPGSAAPTGGQDG